MKLPPTWDLVTVEDIASHEPNAIADGPFGSNLKLSDYVPEGVPVLQGQNITGNQFNWFDVRFISQQKANTLRRSWVRVGDILIVKIGSIGYSARIHDMNGYQYAVIPANLLKVTPNLHIIDPDYLVFWLTSNTAVEYLRANASATAQPALSLGKVKELPIPLPPLPEQRRIAAILARADRLRRLRRTALHLSETYLQSVFIQMFGDPVTNPMGWDVDTLETQLANIDSGWSPVCDEEQAGPNEWAVLKLGAVTTGTYLPKENKRLPSHLKPRLGLEVKPGDVLFTRKNTLDLVAACAFVHKTPTRLMLPDTIFRFVVAERASVIPIFIWGLFSFPKFRKQVQSLATGTAGSMPNISKEKLYDVRIIMPPLPLQQRFAAIAARYERLRAQQREALRQAEHLFATLLHRAFRGELGISPRPLGEGPGVRASPSGEVAAGRARPEVVEPDDHNELIQIGLGLE